MDHSNCALDCRTLDIPPDSKGEFYSLEMGKTQIGTHRDSRVDSNLCACGSPVPYSASARCEYRTYFVDDLERGHSLAQTMATCHPEKVRGEADHYWLAIKHSFSLGRDSHNWKARFGC